MNEAGRPSELTEELTLNIRKLVLDGESYVNVMKILDIASGTWDYWVYKDYHGFRTKLNDWKKERMIKKAELKVDGLIDSDDEKVALNAATFTLETLGKSIYSKKTETDVTSAGKPIFIPSEVAIKNNIQTHE